MTQRPFGGAPLPKVSAILGPTNTGKTFFAIERMLAHKSGMIGLPLRLLAREVYDRIVRLRGPDEVALITGEEKIVPKAARFYVCTVEAMPLEIPVACLVVDEIQLCADPERGHVFTDRLLHARGVEETLFLGARPCAASSSASFPKPGSSPGRAFPISPIPAPKKSPACPAVRRWSDSAPKMSMASPKSCGASAAAPPWCWARFRRAPAMPRSRSTNRAMSISWSPPTPSAWALTWMSIMSPLPAREKFDGRGFRPLPPAEIGQIAGRAGRYMNDGTFGVTGECEPFEEEIVSRVESHRYDPVKVLQWRNAALDFQSRRSLLASLDAPPPERGLGRARPPVRCHRACIIWRASRRSRPSPHPRDAVRRLWEVCQLPDFRKLSADEHAKMVRTLFLFLMSDGGHIPDDWMARQIARLDIAEGDVATLSGRLAQIRTFTYAAHRPGWTRDGAHWQGETRAMEDRLSDALHERLTQRFIDRRTSVLMKHLREDEIADVKLEEDGGVLIARRS